MSLKDFQRPKITSAHIIAVAALVISCAGSASAAIVITSAQIKDGTVTTKDIKNRTLQLRDINPTDRAKLKGADGASAFEPPPAGTLVVGGGLIQGYVATAGGQLTTYTALGFTPAAPLSEDNPTRNVYFAPHASVIDTTENGTLCPGTAAAPDATPGITCIYVAATTNVEPNSTAVYAGVTASTEGADGHGFNVTPDANAVGQMIFRYVWAYRAP
jgi:hypothetical protein